jgi:hypothetical protein
MLVFCVFFPQSQPTPRSAALRRGALIASRGDDGDDGENGANNTIVLHEVRGLESYFTVSRYDFLWHVFAAFSRMSLSFFYIFLAMVHLRFLFHIFDRSPILFSLRARRARGILTTTTTMASLTMARRHWPLTRSRRMCLKQTRQSLPRNARRTRARTLT